MTFRGNNPHLFRRERLVSADKMHVKNGDADLWRRRVEMVSEFAVSNAFHLKKPHSRISRPAVPLQSSDQLQVHDDAYSEAQALLGDWLNSKLRVDLEMDDEDDPMFSDERAQPSPPASSQPTAPTYNNFDDLYNCLVEEEEESAVNIILQDLMKREVLNSGRVKKIAQDDQIMQKRFRDPIVTMEARHQQVRENRARREAERQRKQRERQAQQDARKEARRREREEEMRKEQEVRKEERLVQQEMVRLRQQMKERKDQERLLRERKRSEMQMAAKGVQSVPTLPKHQQQDTKRLHQEQKIQTKIYMSSLKYLQSHFSGWFSVVLERRLCMDKAMVFCDWRVQLRAWRAWRAVIWKERKQRETARIEEALRIKNRQFQLAVESDRRRLLQRCLNEWLLWNQREKVQRELLAQQQETKRKMVAFLSAVSTGTLKTTETTASQSEIPPQKPPNQSETTMKKDTLFYDHSAVHQDNSALHQDSTSVGTASRPYEPWKVTRRHTTATPAEVHKAKQKVESGVFNAKRKVSPGSKFENRHAIQQLIITQQRKLLKEQQEQIAQLKEKQNMSALEKDMERTAQLTQLSMQRAKTVAGEPDRQCAPSRKAVTQQTLPLRIITAMEARAQRRAERRKEIEELKRKKEEEKLAEMKAAAEQRQREEEEEKRKAAEKRREEKRLEREKEEEKQRQLKRQQELTRLANQHFHETLLLRRGLAPWKRLIQIRQANTELAENHHKLFVLRRCTQHWKQSARESLFQKEACADRLHQHFLLWRSLSCWKKLRDMQIIREVQAERFYRRHTLRRFLLALLDYVTQERLVEWDRQELAEEHNNRRVLQQCFLAWRQLPCVMRKERQRDQRRRKLSHKVAEVLPDFLLLPILSPVEEIVSEGGEQ